MTKLRVFILLLTIKKKEKFLIKITSIFFLFLQTKSQQIKSLTFKHKNSFSASKCDLTNLKVRFISLTISTYSKVLCDFQ